MTPTLLTNYNTHMSQAVLNKLIEHDAKFLEHDKRFDAHDKRFDEHDRRFDEIDKRFDQIDEQIDFLAKKVIEHDEKFDALIKITQKTENNVLKIMGTLDYLVKLGAKNDQEMTMMSHGMFRMNDRIDVLEKDMKHVKTTIGLN